MKGCELDRFCADGWHANNRMARKASCECHMTGSALQEVLREGWWTCNELEPGFAGHKIVESQNKAQSWFSVC